MEEDRVQARRKEGSVARSRAGKALYEYFHASDATAKTWKDISKEGRAHYRKAAQAVLVILKPKKKKGALGGAP